MAAAVETLAFTGPVPWHGLGVPVDHLMTMEEALTLGGLDWEVELRDVFAPYNHHLRDVDLADVAEGPDEEDSAEVDDFEVNLDDVEPRELYDSHGNHAWMTPVRGFQAVVRLSDGKPLSVVGSKYAPIQNRFAFRWADHILGEPGEPKFEIAGALRGGRVVFGLLRLPRVEVLPGDEVDPYLLVALSHDGTLALTGLLTTVRVVCQNTLTMALGEAKAPRVSVRHIGEEETLQLQAASAQRMLGLAQSATEGFVTQAKYLSGFEVTEEMLLGFVEQMIPAGTSGLTSRILKERERLTRAYTEAPGQDLPGAKGTLWGLLNAATAYSSHIKSIRGGAEERAYSRLFGGGAGFDTKALNLVRKMAQGLTEEDEDHTVPGADAGAQAWVETSGESLPDVPGIDDIGKL